MTGSSLPPTNARKGFRLNGWHAFAMFAAFFGVVIAVNLTMARLAISSFGGVQVENSYVASQHFNTWLREARDERALGWQAQVVRRADGHVAVTVAGAPQPLAVTATARHPLGRLPDRALLFHRADDGAYVSAETLPAGRWIVRVQVTAGEQSWRDEVHLQ